MTTRIPNYLKNILSTGEGSDFFIVVFDEEGNRTEKKVHKVVIRQCPYFSAMLDLNGTEANSGSATIENITNDIFEYVLRYIYTDQIDDMTMEQAVKVAVAADYLQLEDLKTTSLKLWRDSLMKINTPEDVLGAFRTLVASSLRVKLDDSWRKALESLLIAMHAESNFNIAEESDSFVEFFIDFFGTSHPCLSAYTLAKWATASNLDLTREQRSERKKRTEELLQKIALASLSLQTLAMLSRIEAFPAMYMLKQIQQRAGNGDSPVSDHVEYGLSFKYGRIVELEFESSYALFRFMDVDMIETSANDKEIALWEFLHIPADCETEVTLTHPNFKNCISWPEDSSRGDFSLRLEDFKHESGDFFFKVTLKSSPRSTVVYDYEYYYDELEFNYQ